MKVLVTGATGFIGSHLVEELLRRGNSVSCLVRSTSNLKSIEGLDVSLIRAECSNKETLMHVVEGFDYIFHLAGLTKSCDENDFFQANATCTENLVAATAEKNRNIKRFVYMSSLAAAGPSRTGHPLRESDEPRPVSAYGKSKLEGERSVLKYKKMIPLTILRAAGVYGPRDRDFCTLFRMLNKGVVFYWGKCHYSLLYVDDLVQGAISSAESKTAEGEIYCLSDGNIYSNEEIVEAISSAIGKVPIRIKIPRFIMPLVAGIGQKLSKKSNIINTDKMKELRYPNWTCDSAKAKNDFGFMPQVGLREGMRWTADWYRIHRWL